MAEQSSRASLQRALAPLVTETPGSQPVSLGLCLGSVGALGRGTYTDCHS